MELRILSGLHRGAVMEIDDETAGMTIGASPEGDVDVLLADPGIAGCHCWLRMASGGWCIEPAEGQVIDRHGRALAAAVAVERGHMFRLAEVWIGFFAPNDPWKDAPAANEPLVPARAGRYPRVRAPVAAAVFAAVALPTTWFVSTAWGSVDSPAPLVKAAEPDAVPPLADSPPSPAKLAEEFTRALAERELKDRLDLQLQPEHWEIRGSLEPDERQRLERLLVRFTETRRPEFPIKVSLVSPAELLPFKVIEVITGKTAFIVTDAGERLQIGDVHQGWRLVTVDPGKVVFDGKQRVELAL